MRERYEEELRQLNTSIISMGKMIEVAIESSILALMAHDVKAADVIIRSDDAIDEKEKEIEQLCLKLLLRQQPVAAELRLVTAALKMVTDMERIGDHAGDVADLLKQMCEVNVSGKDVLGAYINSQLNEMGTAIQKMLKDSIEAYINRDVDMAKKVITSDDVADGLYHEIKSEVIWQIQNKETYAEQIADYLLIAKYFERIGDHATNIAEWVIFAMTGDLK
ncbi:MAG: phosphate signaling complex protein PhoU [Spirochaetia bacterium]|nr:phosphate signaling complex protein PhoU [Spirochaetia bacterium]